MYRYKTSKNECPQCNHRWYGNIPHTIMNLKKVGTRPWYSTVLVMRYHFLKCFAKILPYVFWSCFDFHDSYTGRFHLGKPRPKVFWVVCWYPGSVGGGAGWGGFLRELLGHASVHDISCIQERYERTMSTAGTGADIHEEEERLGDWTEDENTTGKTWLGQGNIESRLGRCVILEVKKSHTVSPCSQVCIQPRL